MMIGAFTVPSHSSPSCAVSELIFAFTPTLIAVPAGIVTPVFFGAAGFGAAAGFTVVFVFGAGVSGAGGC